MHRIPLSIAVATIAIVSPARAATYADGARVDALTGGSTWQSCTVVKHNAKQEDYEVRCDGKPDTSRVPDDPAHLRPSTTAVVADTARTNAAITALRAPGPDLDANLRPVTLTRGGQPLSGLYLQLAPMMGNAALGRTQFGYFYFWPDGRVCEMLPPTGTDPADYDAMKAAKPRLCGRYRFTSSSFVLDVPDHAKIFEYAVSRFDGTNFVMDAYPTVRVQGWGAGGSLAGRFAGTRLFPNRMQVTLALDGSGHFELVETPTGGQPAGAKRREGRYRLVGNTLDLDGERHTVYPLDAAKPGRLVFDGFDLDPA